jgi:hypothetical protein
MVPSNSKRICDGVLMSALGERIIKAMRENDMCTRTGLIARKLGERTPRVRREILRLVKSGSIERDERYSFINCTAWKLTGSEQPK